MTHLKLTAVTILRLAFFEPNFIAHDFLHCYNTIGLGMWCTTFFKFVNTRAEIRRKLSSALKIGRAYSSVFWRQKSTRRCWFEIQMFDMRSNANLTWKNTVNSSYMSRVTLRVEVKANWLLEKTVNGIDFDIAKAALKSNLYRKCRKWVTFPPKRETKWRSCCHLFPWGSNRVFCACA